MKVAKLIEELRSKGITDERILKAIERVPRHQFVSEKFQRYAYEDKPLPIDKDQTISQPFTVAYQTQLLDLNEGDKVLEIGTGSGYQASILCEMGMKVYSIERHKPLYHNAQKVLTKLGYKPSLFYGDGHEGLPLHAPFDKIIITAAIDHIPQALKEQLSVGGKLVAPIGGKFGQTMTVLHHTELQSFTISDHGAFVFVPMLAGTEDF